MGRRLWVVQLVGFAAFCAGAVALGYYLPPWHPNQAVLAVCAFGLMALWWSGLWAAAALGVAAGLVCSVGVGGPLRYVDVVVGATVAGAVELRFRPTAAVYHAVRDQKVRWPGPAFRRAWRDRAGGIRVPVRRLPSLIRSTVTGPGAGLGLTAADRGTLIREGQELLGFLGATLYGASWLAAEWFYGSLGVSPEEVGLGAVDLLLVAGVVAVLIAGVVLLLDTSWRRIRHPALRVPAFALFGAVIAGLLAPWPVAVLYALAGAGVAALTASTDAARPHRSARWIPVAASAVVLGLAITSYVMSGFYQDRVAAGRPVTPSLAGFQIAVLWAPTVRVFPVKDKNLPYGMTEGDCMYRLGNADGVTVFYQDRKVFRVPAEAVLSRNCAPA